MAYETSGSTSENMEFFHRRLRCNRICVLKAPPPLYISLSYFFSDQWTYITYSESLLSSPPPCLDAKRSDTLWNRVREKLSVGFLVQQWRESGMLSRLHLPY